MRRGGGKRKEIVLGDDLGNTIVKANGARVEIHTDGSIVAYTKSDVDAYTDGAVHVHPANDRVPAKLEPKPGDRMRDGTIFAGSLEGKKIYAAPLDAPMIYKFNEAAQY